MKNTVGSMIGAAFALGLFSQTAMGFDTCIYVDRVGAVLRVSAMADTAELTLDDKSVVQCTIVLAPTPGAVRTGTCQDQPDRVFPVFTGASDPSMAEDDLLVFRNTLWYRKCAFTR